MTSTVGEPIKVRDSTDAVRRAAWRARRAEAWPTYLQRRLAFSRGDAGGVCIPRRSGHAVFPPGVFTEVSGIVTAANAALDVYRGTRVRFGKGSKKFLIEVLDPAMITRDSPLVQFALRHDVIAGVSAYLGMHPVLSSISVLHSEAGDAPPSSSQLYHCDGADVAQIKVFILCSEVTPLGGPLTILDAATSAAVRRRTKYRYRDRLSDAQLDEIAGARRPLALVGPPGTTCFVDTSRCFHFGSRVSAASPSRLVTVVQYLTPFNFVAASGGSAAPLAHLSTPALSDVQRLVLGTDLQ